MITCRFSVSGECMAAGEGYRQCRTGAECNYEKFRSPEEPDDSGPERS